MMKIPKVAGLILCDRVHVDTQTGQYSLVGIFHSRRFQQFPSPPQQFTAYAALYGGEGEGTMELVVHQADIEKDVHRYRKWYSFPGPKLINVELNVRQCVFPEPGRYLVLLRFEDKTLTFHPLDLLSQ